MPQLLAGRGAATPGSQPEQMPNRVICQQHLTNRPTREAENDTGAASSRWISDTLCRSLGPTERRLANGAEEGSAVNTLGSRLRK